MKKLSLMVFTALLTAAVSLVNAQLEYSAFTQTGSGYSVTAATDYQSLGINPANLGWKRNVHAWNITFVEGGFSVYSEPLNKEQVYTDLFGSDAEKFPDYNVNPQPRFDAIENFTDARLLGSAAITVFGISYQKEKFGGIAFAVRSRIHWNSVLNHKAARFLFLGYNDDTYFEIMEDEKGKYGKAINPESTSQLYSPSHLEHIWYNEYVLGYGNKIINEDGFKLYGGLALKYLQGYGSVYVDIPDVNTAIGYQSLCPLYKVDYGDNETPSQMTGEGLQTAGTGFAFDLGLTFQVEDELKVAVAVNDIGSINWDGNVYDGTNPDVDEIRSDGLGSYNIFGEAGDVISDNTNVGEWEGLLEKKVNLPTNLRAGISYQFNPQWEVGTDLYYALKDDVPGAFRDPVFGIGTRYDPANWVQLSMGFVSGGQFGWDIPFGATFRPVNDDKTSWEIGFAVRDLPSLFKEDDVTVSVVMGLLRFSFGYEEDEKRFLDE
ncbi:MAG: DUF5723 family protein [Bacteroidales bacterium]|nr:DUF5723 family protein [Bacteroidales bacterium]MCF8344612.1 DUF5723 family protein [Bacteroidales bacterium]MCF8351280.1 DUF5723 family protein [Bacteroidales bacterium]MCF8377581.1 DUF5723 family protein [Bacteroidales bacterium]MCF8401838.1 DUF5723 family protein [Bacteroidales bacterium]